MAAEQLRRYSVAPERKVDTHKRQTPQTDVVKKPWITKGEKVLYTFGAIIIALSMIMVVQFSSSIDTLNRDIQQVNSEIQSVKLQNTTLEAEVKDLSKPSRILAIAEEHGLNIGNASVKQASNRN